MRRLLLRGVEPFACIGLALAVLGAAHLLWSVTGAGAWLVLQSCGAEPSRMPIEALIDYMRCEDAVNSRKDMATALGGGMLTALGIRLWLLREAKANLRRNRELNAEMARIRAQVQSEPS